MLTKLKKKLGMKKEFSPDRVIKYLFVSILCMYFVSTVFDLAVTITVLVYSPESFFAYEGNNLLVKAFEEGRFFFNYPILFAFAFPIIFSLSYDLYKSKKNTFFGVIFVSLMICTIIIIAGHVMGGYRWLAGAGKYT